MKILLLALCAFAAVFFVPKVLKAAGVRTIEEDYEAVLVVSGDPNNEKVGKAEWELYGTKNTELSVTVNSRTRSFNGPFDVFLNDEKIGQTVLTEHRTDGGVVFQYHKLELESQKGHSVPVCKDGDTIRLAGPDNVTITGTFIPD